MEKILRATRTSFVISCILIVNIFLLCLTTSSLAAWTATKGPYGGYIWSFAINPSSPETIYVGTDGGGVFESTNGGTIWAAFNTGLTYTDVWSLAINPSNPDTIYVAPDGGGVWYRGLK